LNGKQFRIPVTVYPGVFPKEWQVTFSIGGGRVISANVSSEFVRIVEGEVHEGGASGYLSVTVVHGLEDDQVLISVPGEVLGAPSRVRLSQKELEPA
jgi:hypothetical protein